MIMTIENKRRELFEAWALTCAWLGLGDEPERDGTGYAECETHTAWIAFNAALDAVVIELPPMTNNGFDGFYPAYGVKKAIESTGLGLKVKS